MESQPINPQDKSTSEPVIKAKPLVYSYSSLSDVGRCSARIYFKKLAREGKIQPDVNLPAIFGSAVHAGIETRLKSGAPTLATAQEYLDQQLEAFPPAVRDGKDYDSRYRLMVKCITNFEENFYADLAKTITDPEKEVELRLETPFRKGILVGKVDIALDGMFFDWKTSARVPSYSDIAISPQHGFYWYLAQKSGLTPPSEFVYIYLTGLNLAKTRSESGAVVSDRKNPLIKYSWQVPMNAESVEKLFKNTVLPLAKIYEDEIYFKNPSAQNCSSCQYRTACLVEEVPVPEIES